MEAVRFFNTEGPVRADDHYCIPPLERIDLEEVLDLVRSKKYFVLHAPRQTGKTSALLALRDLLNGGAAGDYRCVYANFEVGQAAREDTARAMRAMLGELARRARITLGDETPNGLRGAALETEGADGALIDVLSRWAEADPRPLVLLIDEIDTLVGDTLLSVLRQLRAGYDERPGRFPHSVVLCGVRDVRDYRVHSTAQNALVLGGSAFNIQSKSLRLGDFSEAATRALLGQHAAETGQAFAPEALELIRTRTAGQPWLVNALCREACFESEAGRDRSRTIAADDILDAQERLIDKGLHGPVWGGVGSPDRLRPFRGQNLGGEDLPPRCASRRRLAGHRLGHVTVSRILGGRLSGLLQLPHRPDGRPGWRTGSRYCLTYFRIRCGPTSAA